MQFSDDNPAQGDAKGKTVELQRGAETKVQSNPDEGVQDSLNNARQTYDMNKIREVIEKTPDIRKEKVALLKQMIASGEYDVNAREIAEKMIREFLLDDVLKS